MPESIIDLSRDFLWEIVMPTLEREFPDETAQAAFGVFGYGSEVLRLDDEYSRDHHWGIRINGVLPDSLFQAKHQAIVETVGARLPTTWRDQPLREGYTRGGGLELASFETYLARTIGIAHAPETYAEWLAIPEEDITHIIGGEVWHDPSGRFTHVRETLLGYYPEPVRLRRIAHWCRYYSGMGTYALHRARLRENDYYSNITFTRALRLGVQLAFLLDKTYYPYDKWTFAYFQKLPRMWQGMGEFVTEAAKLSTPWDQKLELLNQISDVLDQTMVEDGIIQPHPKYRGSETSGYRLLENAYAEIIQGLPAEIKTVVPIWDQIYFESFHSGFVDGIDMQAWRGLLNLTVEEEKSS